MDHVLHRVRAYTFILAYNHTKSQHVLGKELEQPYCEARNDTIVQTSTRAILR